jgi:hypothetical protein
LLKALAELTIWSEPTFCHSKKEAASHQAAPVESRRLDRCDETPEEDAECTPLVWWELLPAHTCPSGNGDRQQELMQVMEVRKMKAAE